MVGHDIGALPAALVRAIRSATLAGESTCTIALRFGLRPAQVVGASGGGAPRLRPLAPPREPPALVPDHEPSDLATHSYVLHRNE
jgi:hypothetical protein